MDTTLLLARLLLAGIFIVAAIAKLSDLEGSRKAITDFGLPNLLARPLGLLLPLMELVIASLLMLTNSTWWGALGALTLLLIFTIGISISLAQGRKPDCHCFGQLHSTPVGWSTLLRNVLLAACAGFIVWQGRNNFGFSPTQWMSGWASSQIVTLLLAAALIIALVSEGWLILYLLRQNGRLLLRMDNLEEVLNAAGIASNTVIRQPVSGLPIGSSAPSFELPVVSGGRLTLDAMLGADKPVLLIFSDPNCVPCDALMPDIAYWERDHASKLTLALISRGGMEANHAKTIMYGLRNMLIQQDREVAEKYQAYVTPSAVLVHPNGSIGTYLAVGPQAIAELVARTTDTGVPIPLSVAAGNGHHKDSHTAPLTGSELKIGESAPLFNLPDLKGHSVKLNDFKGRDTIIIFWNPTCGFCNNMLPALRAWERNRQGKVPELLMISTGTVEANQSMELQSTVVLDQSFSAGRAFGVGGTPSAVLINAEGKIASAIAVGAPEVLALAAGPKRLNVDRQYAGL